MVAPIDWLTDNVDRVIQGLRTVDPAEWDEDEATIGLAFCVTLLNEVRATESAISNRLTKILPPGTTHTVPGVGQAIVEAKGKCSTKGAVLARRVAALVSDVPADLETGEVLPPAVLAERVADDLVAVFGLDNQSATFRAGEVKKRNLRPGDFQEWTDGEPRVRFIAGARGGAF